MLSLHTVEYLPADVNVEDIAEDALQAAFALICSRLETAGYGPVYGDVMPGEQEQLKETFEQFVRMMAVNSPALLAFSEGRCTGTRDGGVPGRLEHDDTCPVHDAEDAPPVIRYEIVDAYNGIGMAEFDATCPVDALAGYSISEGFADPRDVARDDPEMSPIYRYTAEGRHPERANLLGMVVTNYEVYAQVSRGESDA
jgi:hypothetical protein